MKNKLIMMVFVLLGSMQLSFSQNVKKVDVNVMYDDAKKVTETVYTDSKKATGLIVERLDTFTNRAYSIGVEAAKLAKEGVDNTWRIIVKQQRVISCYLLMLWLIAIFGIINSYKMYRKYDTLDYDDNKRSYKIYIVISLVWMAISLGGFILISFNMKTIYTGLFNPEYGALEQIYYMIDNYNIKQ